MKGEYQPATPLGATMLPGGDCEFLVWAPKAKQVELHVVSAPERAVRMEPKPCGYHQAMVPGAGPGCRYFYRLDGKPDRPDPASRFQPDGVHGASQVIDPRGFNWQDSAWRGLPLQDYFLYELHVGAFTREGTFEAIIPRLDDLGALGVTAIEIMPIAQFPGARNWGYDGAYPFAAQASYGGPAGLQKLVDACHARGLAVVLDVVYNHLGPEGNYLGEYGPYFSDRYHTPWGSPLNYDGAESDQVRRFFIESALYWLEQLHIDALRLDAIHGIFDASAQPFLAELSAAARSLAERLGRKIYLIAETSLNDVRVLRRQKLGGFQIHAQWNDDFHHALHAILTGERQGYYIDFGRVDQMAKALREGYVYTGQYSEYRRRRHGNSSAEFSAGRFVVYSQNHDQVGNRAAGDRLSQLVSFEALKTAAGMVILSPFIPLLFMGEEYGESAPFQYFTSHSDPKLAEAVRKGRAEEFASFGWKTEIPDPQAEETFLRSRPDPALRNREPHRTLLAFYRRLIQLRRELAGLARPSKRRTEVWQLPHARVLAIRRWSGEGEALMVFNLSEGPQSANLPCPAGKWTKEIDSAEECWRGGGSSLPESLSSDGFIELDLPESSLAVFSRAQT